MGTNAIFGFVFMASFLRVGMQAVKPLARARAILRLATDVDVRPKKKPVLQKRACRQHDDCPFRLNGKLGTFRFKGSYH
jgi:hypothetical protein